MIGVIFGGDTGKQRNKSLQIIMDKEFAELNISNNILNMFNILNDLNIPIHFPEGQK